MKLKTSLISASALARCRPALPAIAGAARRSIYVPLLTYRTGPFAGSGIPIANGMPDYLKMLNERDGGIGGVKIVIEECETGYDTKKGVECYEQVKAKNPVVVNPWSTGITLQLIPQGRGRQDPDPVDGLWPLGLGRRRRLSRGSSIRRRPIGTALSMIVKYIGRQGRRPRQAQGQEDRLHLSRRAATARSRSRCSSSSPRITASS